jgi:hypothetical protein
MLSPLSGSNGNRSMVSCQDKHGIEVVFQKPPVIHVPSRYVVPPAELVNKAWGDITQGTDFEQVGQLLEIGQMGNLGYQSTSYNAYPYFHHPLSISLEFDHNFDLVMGLLQGFDSLADIRQRDDITDQRIYINLTLSQQFEGEREFITVSDAGF